METAGANNDAARQVMIQLRFVREYPPKVKER